MHTMICALESGVVFIGKIFTVVLNGVVFVILNVQILTLCRKGGV